jgi:hypothetical protein
VFQPAIISPNFNQKKDSKQSLKQLQNNINKALLPNIQSGINSSKKSKSCETREKSKEKKFEFIHEEYYDPKCKGKFTIFNKYALEIEDESTKNTKD